MSTESLACLHAHAHTLSLILVICCGNKRSFGFVKGSDHVKFCKDAGAKLNPKSTAPWSYASSGAVTINGACGAGRVCAITAMPEFVAMDGVTLATTQAPQNFSGSFGNPQTPYPPQYGPSYFSGAHVPTDANGDAYGAHRDATTSSRCHGLSLSYVSACSPHDAAGSIYVFDPKPGYRIFRIRNGSNSVETLPDVPASGQPGDDPATAPSYNHQSLAFTPSFIIVPEMPLRMPKVRITGVPRQARCKRLANARTRAPLVPATPSASRKVATRQRCHAPHE